EVGADGECAGAAVIHLTLVCCECARIGVELVGHAPPARRPSDRSPSDALRLAANHRTGAWSAAVPSLTRTVARARARTCKAGDTRIMALSRIFVGIDVSKDWLDLWLEPLKRFERMSNDAAGWAAVIALLRSLAIEPAGL